MQCLKPSTLLSDGEEKYYTSGPRCPKWVINGHAVIDRLAGRVPASLWVRRCRALAVLRCSRKVNLLGKGLKVANGVLRRSDF